MTDTKQQDNKSLKKAGFRALIWDFIGKLLHHGMGIVVSLFLCRLLEPSDFGLIGMAGVFIALSSVFIDFNLSSGLIHSPNPTQEQYSTVFFLNVMMALLLMFFFLMAAPLIGMFYHNTEVTSLVRVLAFGPVINAICGVQRAKFVKKLDLKSIMFSSLAGALISGPCGVAGALYGWGVWALIIQYYLSITVEAFELWRRSDWRPSLVFSVQSIKELWTFSSRLFFTGLVDNVFSRLDVLVVGKMFSPATLGYYNKSKSYNEFIINYVSSGLSSVLFPVFSKIQSEMDRIRYVFLRSLHILSLLSIGLMGLFYLITEDFVIVMFSQKWTPSIPFYRIIILSAYAYPVSSLLVNVVKGRGRSDYVLWGELLKKTLLIAGFVLGFIWGMEGYLWAMVLVAFVSTLFINGYFVEKEIGYKRRSLFFCMAVYFLIAMVCTVLGFGVYRMLPEIRILRLITGGLFYTITYLVVNKAVKTSGWIFMCEEIRQVVSSVSFSMPAMNRICGIVLFLFR